MAIFDVLAVLMVLAATFGWVNDRYVRLPITVGVMAIGLALSLALIALSLIHPPIKADAERLLAAIDFDQLLLHGALGFLLFAGALHIELGDLREHRASIGVLAVVGTFLSTVIVGGLCWLFTRSAGSRPDVLSLPALRRPHLSDRSHRGAGHAEVARGAATPRSPDRRRVAVQ